MTDPSYIRTVNIKNIENHPDLGMITNCIGMRPYKGRFPDDIIVGRVDGAKAQLSLFLYLLKTTPLALGLFFPKRRLEIFRRLGMNLFKLQISIWDLIPDKDYSRPVREIGRAIATVLDTWQVRMLLNFKYTFMLILEFDDAYRFRLQDLLGELNKQNLILNPRKELKRLIDLGIQREHWEGVQGKFKSWKKLINLIPKKILNKIVLVLLELDMDKVKLDESDMDWAVDKPYDFGGVAWKGREYSLQRGQESAKLNTMDNQLSPEEHAAFDKELAELCARYRVNLQIENQPKLVISRKTESVQIGNQNKKA